MTDGKVKREKENEIRKKEILTENNEETDVS